MIIDAVRECGAFAIYGAQVVAYGAYRAIRHLAGKSPACFLVSDPAGNPAEIDGIPVYEETSEQTCCTR